MKSIDWEAVQADYLMHRDMSMAALAKKHHMRERTVREVAERDHWQEQREARSAEIAHQALVQSGVEQASALADFDSDCLRCAQTAVGLFHVLLAQHRKPHEVRALLAMVRDAQAIGRLALGASRKPRNRYLPMRMWTAHGRVPTKRCLTPKGKTIPRCNDAGRHLKVSQQHEGHVTPEAARGVDAHGQGRSLRLGGMCGA